MSVGFDGSSIASSDRMPSAPSSAARAGPSEATEASSKTVVSSLESRSATGPGGDDPAGVHDDDVAAGQLDLGEQVAGDDDGAAGRGIRLQDRAHRRDLGRVETVGRLVEEEHLGPAEHGLGDAEALLHAVAVGADRAVEGAAERRDGEGLVDPGLVGGASGRGPVGLEVLAAGEVGEEAGALDEGSDPAEDLRAGVDRSAEDVHRSRVGGDEAEHHPHRRRLAGAVGAEQADDLAALGPPGHVVDGTVPVGIRLDEAVDDERDVGVVLADDLAVAAAAAQERRTRRSRAEQGEDAAGEGERLGVALAWSAARIRPSAVGTVRVGVARVIRSARASRGTVNAAVRRGDEDAPPAAGGHRPDRRRGGRRSRRWAGRGSAPPGPAR